MDLSAFGPFINCCRIYISLQPALRSSVCYIAVVLQIRTVWGDWFYNGSRLCKYSTPTGTQVRFSRWLHKKRLRCLQRTLTVLAVSVLSRNDSVRRGERGHSIYVPPRSRAGEIVASDDRLQREIQWIKKASTVVLRYRSSSWLPR